MFPIVSSPKTISAIFVALLGIQAFAAGTLTPLGSAHQPIQIQDHHVNVVINNGFSKTEVIQTFFNPNDLDLEATYACPVPKSASLSEFSMTIDEREIHGEVIEVEQAQKIYEEERDKGNETGLATKEEFQTFHFRVAPVRAGAATQIRYVYYQPVAIDTGVGRYLYPLEDGGTDEAAASFWYNNPKVEQSFSLDLELKSAWPIADIRLPGFENQAQINERDGGGYHVRLDLRNATLNRDLVCYYRLADNLPGRVEMISYKPDEESPGTFMMVLTPGIDLQPLNRGADYVFVLDVSGSMADKIRTLGEGVSRALGEMKPGDRFRIVSFASQARELTSHWVDATAENVGEAIQKVKALRADGSTNLHDGLSLALKSLDDDRATSLVLVTDATTNTGVLEPREFHKLMKRYDVRVFGFLLGNNANWPLMRTICDASGGFWTGVSNADDIIGQILLAKSKVVFESLHHAEFSISGVSTSDLTQDFNEKIYRGQQLVVFGRYARGGTAKLRLKASLTGEDKDYTTQVKLPDFAEDHPELERLWAMSLIEQVEDRNNSGALSEEEAERKIRELGVAYQLVTDHTAMLVLSDEAFAEHGIERRNHRRTEVERQAQARRASTAPVSNRVDDGAPMFDGHAPSAGNGGGALDPLAALLALAMALVSFTLIRKQS